MQLSTDKIYTLLPSFVDNIYVKLQSYAISTKTTPSISATVNVIGQWKMLFVMQYDFFQLVLLPVSSAQAERSRDH